MTESPQNGKPIPETQLSPVPQPPETKKSFLEKLAQKGKNFIFPLWNRMAKVYPSVFSFNTHQSHSMKIARHPLHDRSHLAALKLVASKDFIPISNASGIAYTNDKHVVRMSIFNCSSTNNSTMSITFILFH